MLTPVQGRLFQFDLDGLFCASCETVVHQCPNCAPHYPCKNVPSIDIFYQSHRIDYSAGSITAAKEHVEVPPVYSQLVFCISDSVHTHRTHGYISEKRMDDVYIVHTSQVTPFSALISFPRSILVSHLCAASFLTSML